MRIIKLKNNTEASSSWIGVTIGAGEYYQLQNEQDLNLAVSNVKVNQDIWSGAIIINDGTVDLSAAAGDSWLKGNDTAPKSVNILTTPDPVPFAQPLYRTKRDATAMWAECIADDVTTVDFLLTAERYVSGGDIIFKDAKEGDYISAEVMDLDSVIPAPYRAALCEAHPSVAKYIIKMWLKPCTGYDSLEIDTYPLNAKISAGLYLRVSYHATDEAGTRKMAVGYHLTKKL